MCGAQLERRRSGEVGARVGGEFFTHGGDGDGAERAEPDQDQDVDLDQDHIQLLCGGFLGAAPHEIRVERRIVV